MAAATSLLKYGLQADHKPPQASQFVMPWLAQTDLGDASVMIDVQLIEHQLVLAQVRRSQFDIVAQGKIPLACQVPPPPAPGVTQLAGLIDDENAD